MKRVISVLGAAALIATLAPATTSAAEEPRQRRKTRIVLKIKHCKGCKVQAVRVGRKHVITTKQKRVRHGKVRFRIRTRRTRGLTFAVSDPRSEVLAVPFIVSRYRGERVGSRVTNKEARRGRRASPCWSGTKRRRVVRRVRVRHYTNDWGTKSVRLWFRRTQRSRKPYLRTVEGTLAAQDYIPCARR